MKIGIDIRLIGKKQTGSEAVFFNLVKNLAVLDKKNEYFLFTDISDKAILQKIKTDLGIENKNNFKIISLKTKNKFSWNFWTLPRYINSHPIDIYLTQYITPFFVSRKIKIFTIIHDVSFCVFPELIKFSDLFFLRTLIPLSIKRSDKVIAVSQFTRDEIIKHYKTNPDKVLYIYNAVSDSFLDQVFSQEELIRIREKYQLPQKFILYLGTLQPRKNVPILLEAYAEIKNKFPEVKLVLAGGKGYNYDTKIDSAIKEFNLSNDVIFTGFVAENDKKGVMLLANCFCFPSRYEGFGIPILESYATKIPVIASDILPHHEVAGENGIFFDSNNSCELAEKIVQVLSLDEFRQEMILEGEKRLQLFSWQKTAKRILDIFQGR